MKLLQNRIPDQYVMKFYSQKAVTLNSRTASGLSDKIKFIENGQDLTKWLAHESGYIPRRPDFSNFNDIYLRSQRCGEVRFWLILIVLIYSIDHANLGSLPHR